MLTMDRVGPNNFLIDLGPGDGHVVFMAAQRFDTRGIGVDLNLESVGLSEHRAGVADRGVRYDYSGCVKGDSIEGEVVISDDQRRLRWVATRQ